ncbi:MAG: hypothetical protein ABSE86_08145 [Bryobacteraceae bacterium]|jgi:hypothetical protein
MPGEPTPLKDAIIVVLSTVSLVVSGISLWESDQNRRLSYQTAQDGKDLQTKLTRPWVTVSAITLLQTKGHSAIEFSLNNSGASPAMFLTACPILSTLEDVGISKAVDDFEQEGSMDMNTLSQGQTGKLQMAIAPGSEIYSALQQRKNFRYAIRWSYQGILGTKHRGKQIGLYNFTVQTFTLEGQPVME